MVFLRKRANTREMARTVGSCMEQQLRQKAEVVKRKRLAVKTPESTPALFYARWIFYLGGSLVSTLLVILFVHGHLVKRFEWGEKSVSLPFAVVLIVVLQLFALCTMLFCLVVIYVYFRKGLMLYWNEQLYSKYTSRAFRRLIYLTAFSGLALFSGYAAFEIFVAYFLAPAVWLLSFIM